MSAIDKKPFIVQVLDTLSKDETEALAGLVNGEGTGPVFKSLIPHSPALLTTSDKGIKEVQLEVAIAGQVAQSLYTGYLIYNNTYCVLISYSAKQNQALTLIEMELASGIWNHIVKSCNLSITDLRSELNDRLLIAGAIVPENVKFTVSNIKALTDDQINDLKVGDMVAKKTGNQFHVYVVTYKENNQGICLTYADASVVETQSYDYTEGHWVYNSEDKTELGSFDPSSLYGKFVRIMTAPESTTLTDEQINIIKEGVFINGDFLGYKNPILCPSIIETQYNRMLGIIISGQKIGLYTINTLTKQITKDECISILQGGSSLLSQVYIYNKGFPQYPANQTDKTYSLKLVNGDLTWVEDI